MYFVMILYHVMYVILLLYRLSIKYHTYHLFSYRFVQQYTFFCFQIGLNSFNAYRQNQSFITQEKQNEWGRSLGHGDTSSVQACQNQKKAQIYTPFISHMEVDIEALRNFTEKLPNISTTVTKQDF